jgi:hypothetical protein
MFFGHYPSVYALKCKFSQFKAEATEKVPENALAIIHTSNFRTMPSFHGAI